MDSALPQQINNLLRTGVVTAVDHDRAVCRVQTGEAHTDFIPWLAPAAGELSVWAPPAAGEQVALICCDGDLSNAIALRGLYCEGHPAPSNNPDLVLVRFKDGAAICYDSASHQLSAVLPSGGKAAITADGGVTINGPVTINGAVTVNGKAEVSEDVVGGGVSLKQHKHGGVQPGGGNSGPPA